MCCGALQLLVARGDLYAARRAALAFSTAPPAGFLAAGRWDEPAAGRCAREWVEAVDALLSAPNHLTLIDEAHRRVALQLGAPRLAANCSTGGLAARGGWEACCSSLRMGSGKCEAASEAALAPCCAFSPRSRAFLRIPAIREIWVRVGVASGAEIHIEQDGFLRPFDTPTVLWPAGYLLTLWASEPATCEQWKGARVLELGTGVGTPSIAAAKCGASMVIATDIELRSLALAQANAALNQVPAERFQAQRFDWHNDSELQHLLQHAAPFTAVLGAALMFEGWTQRMWTVLRRLTEASPGAVIVLAHSTGSLKAPPDDFVEERVSGIRYGMHTAWNDHESDFELQILRRRALQTSQPLSRALPASDKGEL
ncbi:hypothetical protein AB1Y20_020130 [Prymnesium parvum]|uniref:Calmodulin-lysine N-methyltransferase n=1 Tax=Prymnesium parvum TaxID=97485 RepID=A0AB34JX78_PRYPA